MSALLRPLDYDERMFLDKIHNYYQLNRPEESVLHIADCGGASGAYTDSARIVFWDFINRFQIYEPVPDSYTALRVKYEGLGDITVVRKAVTNSVGKARFGIGANPEHSQVMVTGYDGRVITVNTTTVDSEYCHHQRLHILKLDIEGEEVNAIRGAKRMISEGRIDFIQFEYGGTWIARKETLQNVQDLLRGWKIYRANVDDLANSSLHLAPLDDDYSMRNYLCVAPHISF